MRALYDLAAPAKLNLFLHIVGRRPDGYHLLQSAFMLIDWCDTLHFELRPGAQLSREDLAEPLPADDLVLRAARALQAHARPGQGAHIAIAKELPAQAGSHAQALRVEFAPGQTSTPHRHPGPVFVVVG